MRPLQEEWQNSIPGRVRKVNDSDNKKDRKREKKDKKKVRKDKKSDVKEIFHSAAQNEKQFSNKSYRVDSIGKEFKGELNFEVFGQSNLTEEHGRPINSQNVSGSSDSTENSCKRKWDSPPASSTQGTGNIIRIRLSSQKRDDWIAMDSLPSQKSDWASKIQESSICQNGVNSKVWEPFRFDKSIASIEDPSSSGRVVDIKLPLKKLSSHERRMLKRESLYKNLFNSLVVDPLVSSLDTNKDDDDDWLFGKRDEEILAKKQRGINNLSCSVSAIQPHSRLLSNVEVYALPFTVPF
ncbi:hypothetical protein KSS87_011753 [Heliosperma pusillum]|nr:hypothetical protein KSS87_011753 [Heliosperma pusillum]